LYAIDFISGGKFHPGYGHIVQVRGQAGWKEAKQELQYQHWGDWQFVKNISICDI